MPTTSSVFYNRINTNYPTPGKDNDSQGFRDNFNNIKLAIQTTDELVNNLSLSIVSTSTTNNFDFNTIKRANFQDCSVNVFDDTQNIRSQAVTVNYSNGSYQKFLISNGTTVFNVINWPTKNTNPDGLAGHIILSITPESTALTKVDFGNYVPVGETTIPFTFESAVTSFFELWTDDGGSTVYVNQIGYKTGIVATGTTLIATDSVKIGTNTYRTGTNFQTLVFTETNSGTKVANLAYLPDIFQTTIDASTVYQVGSTTANYFNVLDTTGIYEGAIVNFTGTTSVYIVDYVVEGNTISSNTGTVYTTSSFSLSPSPFSTGSIVTFNNPEYNDTPRVVVFTTATISSTTGTVGDYQGLLYANSSSLFIAYEDYGVTTTNWVKFYGSDYIDNSIDVVNDAKELNSGTTVITQSTQTDNQTLATTEFVHNVLPARSIIMWGGQPNQIPYGWALCDGQTVNSITTPDLRDKFIIGATTATGVTAVTTITGVSTSTGGNKDAVVVSHNHTATISNDNHQHTTEYPYLNMSGGGSSGFYASGSGTLMQQSSVVNSATTNIAVTIGTEGVAGTNANLPPFYALCFIMKVI